MSAAEPSYPERFAVPAGRRATGALRPPPSKSITQRYFALALLGGFEVEIEDPLLAEDTELFLAALAACGLGVERAEGRVVLTPGPAPPAVSAAAEIFCGNGGTMFRFLTAALTALPGDWRLDGVPRLRQRPIAPLVEALGQLGARIEYLDRPGHAPLRVAGGSLRGGRARLEAGESSQYLSALLMAGLAAPEGLELEVGSLTSSPYVELTLEAIREVGGGVEQRGERLFRVRPTTLAADRLRVEADFSAAAYPAAAAALTGGRVRLEGLGRTSRQGDRAFFDLLARMGAEVAWRDGAVEVTGGELQAITADLSALPDQVPTLAALAPFARGTTRIQNVPHLRFKESDRLAAMANELGRLGAEVEEGPDHLVIRGTWADSPPPEEPVEVRTWGDHRIAMSLALTGLRRPGVVVREPAVVRKSYPRFWLDLAALTEK